MRTGTRQDREPAMHDEHDREGGVTVVYLFLLCVSFVAIGAAAGMFTVQ